MIKKYRHYKNNKLYIITNYCKIQENNEWVLAVLYKQEHGSELYVRTLEEFNKKFYEFIL